MDGKERVFGGIPKLLRYTYIGGEYEVQLWSTPSVTMFAVTVSLHSKKTLETNFIEDNYV